MKAKKDNRTCGNCAKWSDEEQNCHLNPSGWRNYEDADGLQRPTKMYSKMKACPYYFNQADRYKKQYELLI